MLEKFLREAVVVIVGKQSEKVADLLDSKKHVNEFIISKKMDITINQTRNILYKLSDYGLVSSIRKKDKRKGWYTYFWRIEVLKCLEFLKEILEKKIEQASNQIKNRETKQFYACEKCNIEFNEENALLHNFTCNECGSIFTAKDNSKILKEAKRESDKYHRQLELINGEIGKEKEKAEKIKLRVMKKEEEIKRKAKEKAREKKAKDKVVKKVKKGVVKKKVKKKPKKKFVKKIKKKVKKKVVKKKTGKSKTSTSSAKNVKRKKSKQKIKPKRRK